MSLMMAMTVSSTVCIKNQPLTLTRILTLMCQICKVLNRAITDPLPSCTGTSASVPGISALPMPKVHEVKKIAEELLKTNKEGIITELKPWSSPCP